MADRESAPKRIPSLAQARYNQNYKHLYPKFPRVKVPEQVETVPMVTVTGTAPVTEPKGK